MSSPTSRTLWLVVLIKLLPWRKAGPPSPPLPPTHRRDSLYLPGQTILSISSQLQQIALLLFLFTLLVNDRPSDTPVSEGGEVGVMRVTNSTQEGEIIVVKSSRKPPLETGSNPPPTENRPLKKTSPDRRYVLR